MAPQNRHILGNFETAMQESKAAVLTMASIAEQNLDHAIRGLLERNRELCNASIAEDDDVNNLERSIDNSSLEILLRFNPVASDLRQVLSTMRIANNLERISDQAENIARRARKVIKHPEVPEVRLIEPLFQTALGLLRDSLQSFSEGDIELGMGLYDRDQKLDKEHRKVIKALTQAIERDGDNLRTYINLMFIVRCIERIGDHSVNIGEDAIFAESASDIRHVGAAALDDA